MPGSPTILVSSILILQAAVFYTLPKERPCDSTAPLSSFPPAAGRWRLVGDVPLEQEALNVLKADDTLSRIYALGHDKSVNFFVAFFRSQRTGVAPHSPKNCLPGSGWVASRSDVIDIRVPQSGETIQANRYMVAKGEAKSLVLYWYQSHNRTVASEYWAKIYLVIDSVRHRRSDTAIVRVTVPITQSGEQAATEAAADFVRASYPVLKNMLPK